MNRQTIIWTTLPNGKTGERLRLSLFLSPRLTCDEPSGTTTLRTFPDLADWTANLRDGSVTFTIEFDDGPSLSILPTRRDELDPARWRATFSGATNVICHEFEDLSDAPIVSYPATRVHDYLKRRYQALAVTSPTSLPNARRVRDAFAELAGLGERSSVWQAEQDRRHAADSATRTQGPRDDFADLLRFHDTPPPTRHEQPVPVIDFHRIVSSLGEYPAVLRRFGLVLDFEIPIADLPPGFLHGKGKVRVVPEWMTREVVERQDVSPWTVVGLARFRALSRDRNPAVERGFIDPGVPG